MEGRPVFLSTRPSLLLSFHQSQSGAGKCWRTTAGNEHPVFLRANDKVASLYLCDGLLQVRRPQGEVIVVEVAAPDVGCWKDFAVAPSGVEELLQLIPHPHSIDVVQVYLCNLSKLK